MSLGKNISDMRREKGITQAELGALLCVSNQAVSKWESEMTMPDVMLLPQIADVFGCSIDALFSHEPTKTDRVEMIEIIEKYALPWNDDGIIRGVVFDGRRMLDMKEIKDKFTFEITGETKQVSSECSITVNGHVSGGCNCGDSITIKGSLSGGCNCGASLTVGGSFSGGCNCGHSITVGGSFNGKDVTCSSITVIGNVEAEHIRGAVTCNELKCEKVDGYVEIVKKQD